MNSVQIIGRLTADPELRRTQSGISCCRFTVAVNRKFKNQNGEYDADFISCTAWRQTAEFFSRYFSKGKMIALQGTLRTGSYTDKNHSDVTHYTTDVFVESIEFTGEKKQQETTSNYQPPQQNAQPAHDSIQLGDLSDFEEILSDGEVPF